jgi:hypothetical protein
MSDEKLDGIILKRYGLRSMEPSDLAFFRWMLREAIAESWAWRPMETAEGVRCLGLVNGVARVIAWGKTSHVPMYGWCLADQGPEDFDLCEPTGWLPLPNGQS